MGSKYAKGGQPAVKKGPVSDASTETLTLLDKNCILYFSSTEQLGFYEQVMQVFDPMTPILIRCGKDVEELPTAKLDTIVEDSRVGTGYLVRNTINLLNTRKNTFIVVYVRDHRSKELPDGRLFCKELTLRVEDIAQFIKQGHFFSVYNGFTDFQKLHLKTYILPTVTSDPI